MTRAERTKRQQNRLDNINQVGINGMRRYIAYKRIINNLNQTTWKSAN